MNKVSFIKLSLLLSTVYATLYAERESFNFGKTTLVFVNDVKAFEPSTFVSAEELGKLGLAAPSKTTLVKAGGFNGAVFAQAGEETLTKECENAVTANDGKEYSIGSAVTVDSCDLKAKGFANIIFVPGPHREYYPHETEAAQDAHLRACYIAMLTAAHKSHLQGIVTVPFGTGIAGYNHECSALQMAQAIEQSPSYEGNMYVVYSKPEDMATAVAADKAFRAKSSQPAV